MNGAQPKGRNLTQSTDYELAAGAFHNLVDSIGKCIKFKSAYCDFELTQDQLSRMTLEYNQQTTDLQKEKQRYTSLMEMHEQRMTAWATEKEELTRANNELNQQLTNERKNIEKMKMEKEKLKNIQKGMEAKVESLNTDLTQEKKKASDLKTSLDQTKEVLDGLRVEVRESKKKLRVCESYTAVLHDIDIGDL